MAEALGLAASVIAVLQITASAINVCYVYQSGVRNAPRDLNRITDQLIGLRDVLENLLKLAQSKDGTRLSTLKLLSGPDGPLPKCEAELKHLVKKLEPASGGWRKFGQAVTWPLKEGEVRATLDHMERTKAILHLALTADYTTLTLAIQDSVVDVHTDIMVLRDNVAVLTQSVESIKHDEFYKKMRDWLKDPNPSQNHNHARQKRQPTTGTWFTEGNQFAQWKKDPHSFFWIHGTVGCGKTVLCSTIIEDVLFHCRSDPSIGMAYFYFDFIDTSKQSSKGLLSSLVMQFSAQLPGSINILTQFHSQHLEGIRQPGTDALAEILKEIIKDFQHAYIILDALDECTEQVVLLDLIKQIVAWKLNNLHILATSRTEHNIEECLGSRASIKLNINTALVEADIRLHIRKRLQTVKALRNCSVPEQEEFETCLVEGAHGMFRWVACQLDALGNCWKVCDVRRALMDLPKDLDETYNRILENIRGDGRDYAFRVLQWLAFSARPVTIEEVAEVLAIDFNRRPQFQPSERLPDPLDILAICSSLVTVSVLTAEADNQEDIAVANDGTDFLCPMEKRELRLAHFSVKEYLISGRIPHGTTPSIGFNELTANTFISRSCLAYLLQFDKHDSLDTGVISQFPLARYAAEHWISHARHNGVANSHCIQELIVELLQPQSAQYFNWVRLCELHETSVSADLSKSSTDIAPPLYYASLLGLDDISQLLILGGADVNEIAPESDYGTALCVASYAGHEAIVKLLLDSGVDVNAKQDDSSCALEVASSEGHECVVRLLLENGAKVNTGDDFHFSALLEACSNTHESVVQLLLDHGADINAKSMDYTALQVASEGGHMAIIWLLLDRGAEINIRTGEYCNALQAALYGGHETIAQLLVDKGADIKAKGGNFGNILQAASSSGNEVVVRLSLLKGVDVNARGGFYGNALQAASHEGHNAVVQLLLHEGADVNAQGGAYDSALVAASHGGHESVVLLLLEHGADVNAIGGDEGSALQAAAGSGHDQVVKILLESGANVNAIGGDILGSALQVASGAGCEMAVQILLQYGADVNAPGPDDSTALQEASSNGHTNIVQLLLDNGAAINNALHEACNGGQEAVVTLLLAKEADVNAQGGTYSYALHAASCGGYDRIVKLLLAKGADPNVMGGFYGTALHAALIDGHKYVVQLLLDNGANFNICIENRGDVLHAATSEGHKEIVQELLDRGAEINSKGGFYGNALQAASAKGYESLVQLLLDRGADVNAVGGYYTTALQAASHKGHKIVVQQLLDKGAHINVSREEDSTSTNVALPKGHPKVVEFLLENGYKF